MKICAVYKITNTITGDFYIGSSKNVKRRWAAHKCKSSWKRFSNNPLYQDMKKYGLNKFVFEILAEVEPEKLKETEQQFIEKLKPTYNQINANGLNVEKRKEYMRKYNKSDKGKEKRKEYEKSDKRKKYKKEYQTKYRSQLCFYNGETLTLNALSKRFKRQGIDHPTIEAKKYLLQN